MNIAKSSPSSSSSSNSATSSSTPRISANLVAPPPPQTNTNTNTNTITSSSSSDDGQLRFIYCEEIDGRRWNYVVAVGCGAGNTVYPLIATYPDVFVHACDFSPRVVNLVKSHKDFSETRVVHLSIFVLSAVSPEKMALILHNITNVLKPNGRVLFRDYATGDLTQVD
ncbi:hypothetical protein ACFE04_011212 [Oxalis oulophora]